MAPARKNILITGCSSGIGRYCAERLHQRPDWYVIASVRKEQDIEPLTRQNIDTIQLDLDDSASIRSAFDIVMDKTDGRLDALFNNGAYGQTGAVEDITREAMRQQFETNVFGTLELTNLAIANMRKHGSGRIVQNSSVLGFVPLSYRGAYGASKYALEGITDHLRLELRGSNIHAISIQPGPIHSDFRKNAMPHFYKHIDINSSAHRPVYEKMIKKWENNIDTVSADKYTLGPEAVYDALYHAITSPNPRLHYRVTTPTILFAFLKRILPTKMLDSLILKY